MNDARDTGAWRQPIVWLGTAIFVASLAACIVTIVIASRHADVPVDPAAIRVMAIPLDISTEPPAKERP